MSTFNMTPVTYAQMSSQPPPGSNQAQGQTPNAKAIRTLLSNVPTEIWDMIMPGLTSQQLYPFLYLPSTYRSASRALYREPIRLVPTSTACTDIHRAIRTLSLNEELVGKNPNLEIAFPTRSIPGWHAGSSYEQAFNAVLRKFNHWKTISIQLGSGHGPTTAAHVSFTNLERLELIGNSSDVNHTVPVEWTTLNGHQYELVLRNTMLRRVPGWDDFNIAHRVRKLTIDTAVWDIDMLDALQSIDFPVLQEFSLFVRPSACDITGHDFADLLFFLRPCGRRLRKLALKHIFTHHCGHSHHATAILQQPELFGHFNALTDLEVPLAHMQHISYFLVGSAITDFAFGIYSASSLHMDTLGHLCTHICNDMMLRVMFPGIHTSTGNSLNAAAASIHRTIKFRLEVDLPTKGRFTTKMVEPTVFAYLFAFQGYIRHAAEMWNQDIRYSNGGMTVHAGDLEVDLSEMYVLVRVAVRGVWL